MMQGIHSGVVSVVLDFHGREGKKKGGQASFYYIAIGSMISFLFLGESTSGIHCRDTRTKSD